ncbi:tetratricopeptide repeat protein [Paucibacter sp. B2R-40]|uniref:SirB1 family protein n=1 Tax=Paucibacter sp. B2R-40 TaxID=2893554 RepID=UPI0021E437EA|nr:tetratricopeptide repeat protein [Paucibacter sp. B2R-40]MCV2353924.1 tetratricopeptide repeat protein [Paucibacter sp. B2R-40]
MSDFLRLKVPTPLEYFASLVAEDGGLNLLEAAASIAQDEFPALDVEAVVSEVEALAQRLRQRMPADASARHKLQALTRYFHEELGFAGNVNNYYESGNSFVHHVMVTRRGIPITLAVIFLELATHLGLRAQGLAFPGHFLIKVSMGNGEVVLDPFTGQSLSRERLDEYLQIFRQGASFNGAVELPVELFMQAAPPRDILARMLRNLKEIYRSSQDWTRLLAVQERLVVLLPRDAAERRDRGLVLEALGQWRAASEDLAFYVERSPQAADGQDLRQRIAQMRKHGTPPLH